MITMSRKAANDHNVIKLLRYHSVEISLYSIGRSEDGVDSGNECFDIDAADNIGVAVSQSIFIKANEDLCTGCKVSDTCKLGV